MSLFGDIGVATRNGFKRVIAARQENAQQYVNGVLLTLDDKTLQELGYTRKEIQAKGARHGSFI